VLNKADVCEDLSARVSEVRALTTAPVVATSALEGDLSAVEVLLEPGETVALMGSSGAGKSTLINRLLGEAVLRTQGVRVDDSRGRHTTTHRELFRLPSGALVIDNPGVREIQPWTDDGEAVAAVFEDVEILARGCRFGDCSHTTEPGCAVREAIERGELEAARLESLQKLEAEAEALDRRKDERRRREHDKSLGKLYKSVLREKKNRR
jgi:ribosome biogenesis GTPase